MHRDNDHWVFDSGRRRYAHSERLSVSQHEGDWQVSFGSDGGFWDAYSEEYQEEKLERADMLELARHQIERWKVFEQWLLNNGGDCND